MRQLIVFILILFSPCIQAKDFVITKDLSNRDDGIENFQYLYSLHELAYKEDGKVIYPEGQDIYLTITSESQTILLADTTDFNNCTIHVSNEDNTRTHFYLFILQGKDSRHNIDVSAELIDKGDFSSVPELAKDSKILCIKDENLWSDRIGYNDQCYRQDILLLDNGKAENTVIYPYNKPDFKPSCWYFNATTNKKIFRDLDFVREKMLYDGKTLLLKVQNCNNILIEKVSITTPDYDKAYADVCINIESCTNLFMDNITIDGTYSQLNQFGYGISLRNVYNASLSHINASAKWGVFGNYFINTASLSDCDINRFDVHCYGKNITIVNSIFKANPDYDSESQNVYNQFSSMYGEVTFKNCTFEQGIPFLIEPSFKFNDDFQLFFTNCIFNIGKHQYLISSPQKLSNVYIDNLQLNNDSNGFKTFK